MKIKGPDDISGYGIASDNKKAEIISFTDRQATHITIPSHYQGVPVCRIGFGAFKGCTGLQKVTIPDTVKVIEGSAFRNCTDLRKAVCSKNTESIGPYAFAGCSELRKVIIPSNIRTLMENAFCDCRRLTDFDLWDMNRNDGTIKHFVVACINEYRRFGFMNACLIYFDNYDMTKYDEGYAVVQEFEDLFNVAEYRLFNNEQLDPYMETVYRNAIRLAVPKLITEDQVSRLVSAGELGIITENKIDEYIELASGYRNHCLAYLLELKEKRFRHRIPDFDL